MKKQKPPSRSTSGSDASRPTPRSDRRKRDYKVGRGRPPVEHQIKPGERRNPFGRPRGSKGLRTILGTVLRQKIKLSVGGEQKEISIREAIVYRFVERALQGDTKAATWVINNDPAVDVIEAAARDAANADEDQKILDAFARKVAAQQAKANKK
jgi:hypothetical protein